MTNKKIIVTLGEDLSTMVHGDNRAEVSADGKRIEICAPNGFQVKAAATEGVMTNGVVLNGVSLESTDSQMAIIAPKGMVFNKPSPTDEVPVAETDAEIDVVPEAGQKMEDGTIYIGRFTGKDGIEKHWFAAAHDLRHRWLFKRGLNLSLTFNEAIFKYAQKAKLHGHKDWVLPPGRDDIRGEPDVLKEMFGNKDKIGGFDESGIWYWSSSTFSHNGAYSAVQRFSDGKQHQHFVDNEFSVRLVRCVAV